MAGNGPPPTDPSKRARRNKTPQMRVIEVEAADQPELPAMMPSGDEGAEWPTQTRTWWSMWRDSPLAEDFTASDWSYLLDTALLHGRLWSGDVKAAPELRLRVAQFGATPADRARLRITFAQADEADEKRGSRQSGSTSARQRHAGLKLA